MFAILEAIEVHQPALIFLACSNNPTGNVFYIDNIKGIIETISNIVVVDEAYTPFVESTLMPSLGESPNLLNTHKTIYLSLSIK